MSTSATVRYIANGYTVNWQGSQAIGVPASLYATSIPEAVYWLGRIFDPVAQPPVPPATRAAPRVVENTDPLLGTEAQITDIASGGFIVRQFPTAGGRLIETYCVDMDAVHGQLNLIFSAP
jgi:hypothetical protein